MPIFHPQQSNFIASTPGGMGPAAGVYVPQPSIPLQQEGIQLGSRASNMIFGLGRATSKALDLLSWGFFIPGLQGVSTAAFLAKPFLDLTIGSMQQGAQLQRAVGTYIASNVRFQGNQPFPSLTGIKTVTNEMFNLSRDLGISTQELSGLMAQFHQMGLMRTVQNIQQFRARFRELTMAAKQVADTLGTSLAEAGQVMAQIRGLGIRSTAATPMVSTLINQARWATGLPTGQILQLAQQGGQLSHAIGGLMGQGAVGMMRALQTMGAVTSNMIVPPSVVEEATGVMGPQANIAMAQIAQQALARRLMSRHARYFMAAAASPDFRRLDVNALRALLESGYGMEEIRRLARRRVYGPEGRAVNAAGRMLMYEEEMRGQLLEQGPMMLAAMLRTELGNRLWNEEDWRVNRWVRRRYGVTKRQADVFLRMARNLPEMIEAQAREEERRLALQKLAPDMRITEAVKRYVSLWLNKNITGPLQRAGAAMEVYLEKRMADFARQVDKEARRLLGLPSREQLQPALLSGGHGAIILQEMLRGQFSPAVFTRPGRAVASPLQRTVAPAELWRAAGFTGPKAFMSQLGTEAIRTQWENIIYGEQGLAARGNIFQAMTRLSQISEGPLGELLAGKTPEERLAIVRAMGERYGWGVAGGWKPFYMTGAGAGGWEAGTEWMPTNEELAQLGAALAGPAPRGLIEQGIIGRSAAGVGFSALAGGVNIGATGLMTFTSQAIGMGAGLLAGPMVAGMLGTRTGRRIARRIIGGIRGAFRWIRQKTYGLTEEEKYQRLIAAGRQSLEAEHSKWLMNKQELAPFLAAAARGDESAKKELLRRLDYLSRHGPEADKEMAQKVLAEASKSPLYLKLAGQKATEDAKREWINKLSERLTRWHVDETSRRLLQEAGLEPAELVPGLQNIGTFLTTVEQLQERVFEMTPEQQKNVLLALERGGSAAEPVTAAIRPMIKAATLWRKYGRKGRITSRKGILATLGQMGLTNLSYLTEEKEGRELLEKALKGSEAAAQQLATQLAARNNLPEEMTKEIVGALTGGVTKQELLHMGRMAGAYRQVQAVADYRSQAIKLSESKKLFGTPEGMHSELMRQTKKLEEIHKAIESETKSLNTVFGTLGKILSNMPGE